MAKKFLRYYFYVLLKIIMLCFMVSGLSLSHIELETFFSTYPFITKLYGILFDRRFRLSLLDW